MYVVLRGTYLLNNKAMTMKNEEFRLIHAVVDASGKLKKLESSAGNVLFAVTREQEGDGVGELVGVPSTTRVNLDAVIERINALTA